MTPNFNNKKGYDPNRKNITEETLPDFNIKNLTKDLFDTTADKCAKVLSNSSNNKPTQLRRFYDELVLWEERASVSKEAFDDALPFIYMIKSKVAYAKGRKHVDDTFKKYMDRLIGQIEDINTLKNAKLFMEAMMGFYKFYKPSEN